MTITQIPETNPIDAVITWVDGTDDKHRRQRARYLAECGFDLHGNAVNSHRWIDSDEILYCLQSIENFAPWTRKIWIVVDHQTPDLSFLSEALRAKISYVFHRDIFGELSAVLPTFNSLAIESMLWRIDGLADQFVYFNDDVFLSAPLHPSDLFKDGQPVLRGDWVDYKALNANPKAQQDPAKFNHFMQLNAARLAGYPASRLFSCAHVVHPFCRDVMAALFDQHRASFVENTKYRFRDLNQFLPQGLHNHASIKTNSAILNASADHLHIKSGHGLGRPPEETAALLMQATAPEIKFLCINDLPKLEMVIPDVRAHLGDLVGGFPKAVPAQ